MKSRTSLAKRPPIDARILMIRGTRVMLDSDLAELYGVTTKRLNEQVKRNRERFPDDFMFALTAEEKAEVVANCDHLSRLKFSPTLRYPEFTESAAQLRTLKAELYRELTPAVGKDRMVKVANALLKARGA